jgi:phosphomannomutase/phosphoglucomutase
MGREINRRLFGTNGVRGIFGRDLTPDLIIGLSYSLATYFEEGPIAIGYDGRNSSTIISKYVSSTINSEGKDIAKVGLVPTPCLQYSVKYGDLGGGVMITASHNPPEYNGIKPIASDGVEISREDELEVEKIYYRKKYSGTTNFGREFAEHDIIDSYINAILKLVDVERIRECAFMMAIDAGNGAQALVAPLLAKKLGCKLIILNGIVDGEFPGRGPEPSPATLGTLSNMVKFTDSDVGVAYDSDGDRSIFCDENGQLYWGDKTGSLLARHLLTTKHSRAEIVCPINTTMVISLVAKEANSNVVFTKVGSVEVSREMIRRKSIIGLEENGGFMYGKLNEVRDGAMTTALVLDMLASNRKRTFSQLMSCLPKIFQFKSKFPCPTRKVACNVINKCLMHGSPKKIETLDGAKIWIDEETWIMIRASGTEPLIRMYAESTDEDLLNSKVQEYIRIIRDQSKQAI